LTKKQYDNIILLLRFHQ